MIGRFRRRLVHRLQKKDKVTGPSGEKEESVPPPPMTASSSAVFDVSDSDDEGSNMHLSKSCDASIDMTERRIGRYKILEILDKTNSTVYLAENILRGGAHGRVVLKKQVLMSPRGVNFISRARMEAKIHEELNKEIYRTSRGYKHIVRMLDEVYSLANNEHYIVLEYCTNGSLLDLLRDLSDPYALEISKRLIKDILLGLQFMHQLGIAHRDIKLDNILLHHDSQRVICKIADFGLSVMMLPDFTDKSMVGNPQHAAPETLTCMFEGGTPRERDPIASDVWALGTVVYTILELSYPFISNPAETESEENLRMVHDEMGMGLTDDETKSLFYNIFMNVQKPRKNFLEDSDLTSFINRMLEHNPIERATTDELLEHGFMNGTMRILKKFEFTVLNRRTEVSAKDIMDAAVEQVKAP